MSTYEWERGEFTLPSAEFARVRRAVQAADANHKKRVFTKTQEFWAGLSRREKTDSEAYFAAVARLAQERHDSARPRGVSSLIVRETPGQQQDQAAREEAIGMLYAKGYKDRPSRVLKTEMNFPTNRTATFSTPYCSVSFNAANRTATWDVPENNHACERARGTYLAAAFFGAIGKVRWTHGTGGVIKGNDEYTRDPDNGGDGANYVKAAYGYLGIEQAPMYVAPFTNAKGQQVTAQVTIGRHGPKGKAVIASARTVRPGGHVHGQKQRSGPAGRPAASPSRPQGSVKP